MKLLRTYCLAGIVLLLISQRALAADLTAADLTAADLTAAGGPCVERSDELWLISTRHCGCAYGCALTACNLDVRRCDASSHEWMESSLDEFVAQPPRLTVIYAHGNRVSWYEAQQHGQFAMRSLVACDQRLPPLRFVIWSWPSDQVRGPLRDVRVKAERSDGEASYFGWFLTQLQPDVSLRLIGYSYGARIISGGLHLASQAGWRAGALGAPADAPRATVRGTYLAPALANGWLCVGGCHGNSLDAVDHLFILYNTCDPALANFHFTDRCSHPTALGYVGIHPSCLGNGANRVEQRDYCCQIGATHDEYAYWCNGDVMNDICRGLFGE